MSEFKSVLTAPIARPAQEITADYCEEGIENVYIPGGWENKMERYYCLPDEMAYVSIESNLTGSDVELFVHDESYGHIEPGCFLGHIVQSDVPLSEISHDNWPIISKTECGYCNFHADIVLNPEGEVEIGSFHHHMVGRLHLVSPELAREGAAAGRFDLVGVTDSVVRFINLTNLPMDVCVDGDTVEPGDDFFNPYTRLPFPYIQRFDSWSCNYRIRNLPPEQPHTIYLVDYDIAVLAHAIGRIDLIPIG